MKGLLLKDVLSMKTYWRTYGAMVVIYAVISWMGNHMLFNTMISVFLLILPLSSFTIDELARWDKFAVALPGGRRAVVKAKYQFLFLALASILVLTLAVNLLLSLFGQDGQGALPELMLNSLGCTAAGMLMNSILYPLIFKFGSQKSRITIAVVMGIMFAAIAIGLTILNLGGLHLSDLSLPRWISPVSAGVLVVVLLAAMMLISFRISCAIYDKKEF